LEAGLKVDYGTSWRAARKLVEVAMVDMVTARQREARMLELRRDGRSYTEIGEAFGISRQVATRIIQRGMDRIVREPAELVKVMDLERLDQLQVEALAVLRRRHVAVSGGKIVRGDDGQPLVDDGPVLAAIGKLLDIQARRARLLGLDAPNKHEVLTLDAIDAEIRRLEEQVAQAPPASPPPSAPDPTPPPAGDYFDHLGGAVEAALDALQLPEDQREVAAQAVEDHLHRHGAPGEEVTR
jgi:hypothetical protein